jgi:Glycosyltransferase family 87
VIKSSPVRSFPARTDFDAQRLALAAASAFALSYVVCLTIWFVQHRWILDGHGQPIFTDFVALWTTGRMALHGAALQAYDGYALHAAEAAALGHGFQGYLGWPYPPMFLFVVAVLGALPYTPAFLIWETATLALYAASVSAIARSRSAILFACAAPWVAADLSTGQNGFLTASLIGAILLTMEDRPVLSGVFLGFLTYKPQFGILFPFVLVAEGRWRVLASASVTAAILALLSGAVFGFETFAAFLHNLPQTTQTLLVEGSVGWNKLQSVYGLTRWIGGSDTLGRVLQGCTSVAGLGTVLWVWRSKAPFALKATLLACATLLATPYVFFYDFPVLAVAMAFLYRGRAFDRVEVAALSGAMVFALAFVMFAVPVALFSVMIVSALILRRVAQTRAAESVALVALQRG